MLAILGSTVRASVHLELGCGGVRSTARAVMLTVGGAACGVHGER
jgi:hypothetical protein